jgi:hypothetical protein
LEKLLELLVQDKKLQLSPALLLLLPTRLLLLHVLLTANS